MPSPNLRERAYRHIRERLLAGDIKGGERLNELSLAKELGISRTPVREAFSQLASEGFVERDPALGVIVKHLSRAELVELLDLRTMLESYAAARAARRITDEQLAQLGKTIGHLRSISRTLREKGLAAWDGPIGRRLALTDMIFHMIVLQASGRARVARIIEDFHVVTTRYRAPETQSLRNLARVLLEHWRIYQALRQRDPHAVRAAMRRHNTSAKRKLITAYDQRARQGNSVKVTDWSDLLERVTSGTELAGSLRRSGKRARNR